jgi:hypothetical protein
VWYILCSNLVKQANSNDRWSHQLKVIRGELRWALSFELWAFHTGAQIFLDFYTSKFEQPYLPTRFLFFVFLLLTADTQLIVSRVIVQMASAFGPIYPTFAPTGPDEPLRNWASLWAKLKSTTDDLLVFFFFLIQIDVVI